MMDPVEEPALGASFAKSTDSIDLGMSPNA